MAVLADFAEHLEAALQLRLVVPKKPPNDQSLRAGIGGRDGRPPAAGFRGGPAPMRTRRRAAARCRDRLESMSKSLSGVAQEPPIAVSPFSTESGDRGGNRLGVRNRPTNGRSTRK